jgi:tetratricopeptide (TPR) repeat protein
MIYSLRGRVDLASAHMEEALRSAEELGHPHTLAFVWTYCALGCELRGEPRGVLALTAKVFSSKDYDFMLWRAWSFLLRCWATGVTGDLDGSLAELQAGLGRWRAAGIEAGLPHFLAMVADLQLRRGDAAAVLDTVAGGIEAAERTGERSYLAELLRLKGEALRRLGQEEAAAGCFEEALAVARSLGTGTIEIRATVSRARQLTQTGFAHQGHALLAALCARFDPALVSVDLQIARNLLEGGGLSPGGPSPDAHPP